MTTSTAFWIDHTYDREYADPGTTSRYGNCVRLDRQRFAEIWYDDLGGRRVEFASIAWQIARGPVTSPPYVRSHDRILFGRGHPQRLGRLPGRIGGANHRPSAGCPRGAPVRDRPF